MENKFKAVVKSAATLTRTKSFDGGLTQGGKYQLHNVEILEGPFKGKIVAGTRTLINKDGEAKTPVDKNQEVVVYHRVEPKIGALEEIKALEDIGKTVTEEERKAIIKKHGNKHFFEISTGEMSASDAELDALYAGAAAQTV